MFLEILAKAAASSILRKTAPGAAALVIGEAQARELDSAYTAAIDALIAKFEPYVPEAYRGTTADILRDALRDEVIAQAMIEHALATPEVSLRPIDCAPLLRERFHAKGVWIETLALDLRDVANTFPALLIRAIEQAASKPDSAVAPLLDVRRMAGIEATLAGLGDRESKRALATLRHTSELAARDAAIVDAGARNVRLDEGLYVVRDVEPKLAEDLARRQTAVVVIGEAGQGKTTLLWNLWRTLRSDSGLEVWLIKPTRLFSGPGSIPREDFVRAVGAAHAEGRRALVLFDTVDVLLHDEHTIDALRDLLGTLHRAGCTIAISTRPAEAPILLNAGLPFAERSLGNYNERSGELERAITAHVRSFYGEYDPLRHGEYVAVTMNAVAAGLPLRQVCLNPLTLRMLFVLYAPDVIPPEINVAELFRQFWQRRVESDMRPGSVMPHDRRDVSAAAETIALTMLHEGTPEVDLAAVQSMLSHWSIPAGDVTVLESRGIVQQSRGKVAFFHQTFFEHAAARMLLRRAGAGGIAALLERVRSRGFDPFLSPVLEQALLLAPADPLLRDAADDVLISLLESDNVAELKTAVDIFAMRDAVSAAVTARVRELIVDGRHETAISGLMAAAANTPAQRTGELFDLVALAWERDAPWRIRQKTFVLLERLAGRCGGAVRECLERIGAVDYVLSGLLALQPESELRDVLRALAPHEPEWTCEVMVRMYAAAGQRSDGLRVKMLRLLAERAKAFGEEDIASRFESRAESESADDTDRDDRADFHAAWARLWTIEWSARATSLTDIFDSIPAKTSRARGRMLALRELLANASPGEAVAVWDRVLGDTNRDRQPLAMITLWTPFLSGTARADTSAAVLSRIKELLLRVMGGEGDDGGALRATLIDIVSRANAPAETIRELFADPSFDDLDLWLRVDRLARIAGPAYLAGHGAATRAVDTVAANPAAHAKVAELLLRVFGNVELTPDRARLVALLVEAAGAARAVRAAEQLSDASLSVLAQHPELQSAIAAWRTARSLNTRRDATRLVAELIRRKAMRPAPFDEIASLLGRETDAVLAGHLAMVAGVSTRDGSYDVARLIELLRPHVLGHEKTRTNALDGLMAAVLGNPAADEHLEAVLDLIMLPPTDQGRLKHAYGLLLRLVEIAPRRAVERFRVLLSSDAARHLGVNARRDLRTALETPARAIVAAATDYERTLLVRDLPGVDPYIAPAVVRPLCHIAYGDLAVALEEIVPYTSPEVQLLIRENAKAQQRVTGSGRWTEVSKLVAPR